ncbi:MAG: hypothetical protein ACI4UL_08955 [Muribaculaceae bacterium]
MKIYVASSWRNEFFPEIVSRLRSEGYDVYDFRNPGDGSDGFRWSDVSADWIEWEPQRYRHELMNNPLCQRQFGNDERAMESCDACVLLLPSGRSAHTEAGWFAGKGRKVIVHIPIKQEPELMYRLFDAVTTTIDELLAALKA